MRDQGMADGGAGDVLDELDRLFRAGIADESRFIAETADRAADHIRWLRAQLVESTSAERAAGLRALWGMGVAPVERDRVTR